MITRAYLFSFLFGRTNSRLFLGSRHRDRTYRRAMLGLVVALLFAVALGAEDAPGQAADAAASAEGRLTESPVPASVAGETPDMVPVPAGSFPMGNAMTGDRIERPVHQVTLQAFAMARTETTRRQYRAAGLNPPGAAQAEDLPVTNVSWFDSVMYCNALSVREGLEPVYTVKGKAVSADFSRNGYRLPTEAEWEYAARSAGRDQTDYSGSERVAEVAWYEANSGHSPHPVATKAANSSGFHDLSGNVWEWCWDYFQNYSAKDQTDPVGPAKGKFRILRGGSCNFNDSSARTGFRSARDPAAKAADVGFRVVRRS